MTREEKVLNYFKKGQVMINSKDEDEAQDKWTKENNPVRWIEIMSARIDHYIKEYNELAFTNDLDIIVAFKMTPAEFAQGMKEVVDGESNETQGKRSIIISGKASAEE